MNSFFSLLTIILFQLFHIECINPNPIESFSRSRTGDITIDFSQLANSQNESFKVPLGSFISREIHLINYSNDDYDVEVSTTDSSFIPLHNITKIKELKLIDEDVMSDRVVRYIQWSHNKGIKSGTVKIIFVMRGVEKEEGSPTKGRFSYVFEHVESIRKECIKRLGSDARAEFDFLGGFLILRVPIALLSSKDKEFIKIQMKELFRRIGTCFGENIKDWHIFNDELRLHCSNDQLHARPLDSFQDLNKYEEIMKRYYGSSADAVMKIVEKSMPTNPRLKRRQWALFEVNMMMAWALREYGIKEVKVAMIDSCFDLTHPDIRDNFIKKYKGGSDVVNAACGREVVSHGTIIAGIIGAHLNGQIVGVAPNITMIPLKLDKYDCNKGARMLKVAEENDARVINASWGSSYSGYGFQKSFEEMRYARNNRGILIIVAAWNPSDGHEFHYPCGFKMPHMLCVGSNYEASSYRDDVNIDLSVDIYAPGVNIYSSLPSNRYGKASGSSFASPHVAGAAALVYSSLLKTGYDPYAHEVAEIIKISARKGHTLHDKSKITLHLDVGTAVLISKLGGLSCRINCEDALFKIHSMKRKVINIDLVGYMEGTFKATIQIKLTSRKTGGNKIFKIPISIRTETFFSIPSPQKLSRYFLEDNVETEVDNNLLCNAQIQFYQSLRDKGSWIPGILASLIINIALLIFFFLLWVIKYIGIQIVIFRLEKDIKQIKAHNNFKIAL